MMIQLSTWQRAGLIQALGAVRGNVATLRLGLETLEVVEFTNAERAEIEYVEADGQVSWSEAGAQRVWKIELGKRDARFAAGAVDRFEEWKAKDAPKVFDLLERLQRIEKGADGE